MRISPYTQHHQQAVATSHATAPLLHHKNPSPTDDPQSTSLQVARLLPEKARTRRASLVKLTDECLAAINEAIKNDWRVRITVAKNSVTLHIGNGTNAPAVFHCTQQNLAGSSDAICHESASSDVYQTVSSVNTKLVVNATDKTFDETRVKAKKLVEEEQKKMTKDLVMKRDLTGRHKTSGKTASSSSSSSMLNKTSMNFKPIGAKPTSSSNGASSTKRISPPSAAAVALITATAAKNAQSPSLSKSTNNASSNLSTSTPTNRSNTPLQATVHNRPELLRHSVRQRVIHLLATCKYKSVEELVERLRFEGVPKNEPLDAFLEQAASIVKEVSELDSDLEVLVVQPKFHKEINIRWPWFVSSERERLRRMIAPARPQNESSNVAPTRRNGAAPPLAPGASSTVATSQNQQNAPAKSSAAPNSNTNLASDKSLSTVSNEALQKETPPLPQIQRIEDKKSPPPIVATPSPRTTPSTVASTDSIRPTSNLVNPRKRPPSALQQPAKRAESPALTNSTTATNSPYDAPSPSSAPSVQKKRRLQESNPRPEPTATKPLQQQQPQEKRKNVDDRARDTAINRSDIQVAKTEPQPLKSNAERRPQPKVTTLKGWATSREATAKTESRLDALYPPIGDAKQALRYHEQFESDYPRYRQYHEDLTKVSRKFLDLKMRFDHAPSGSAEQSEILRRIQDSYDRYQADRRFADTRRKHTDLYAELSLLKQRLGEWERTMLNAKSSNNPQNDHRFGAMKSFQRRGSVSPGSAMSSSNSASSTTSVESLCNAAHLYDEVDGF